jgi:6-phosphogluconolactonase
MNPAVEILPDPEALAHRAAELVLHAAQATTGRFAIALAGGSTPRRMYELMARAPYRNNFPWHRTHVFFGDERFVPHMDERSNYRMAARALLSHAPIAEANVYPVPTSGVSPADAARAYERTLQSFYGAETLDPARPLFDVTLLGLGDNGHIASLFPGTEALSEREHWVVAVTEKVPEPRITLTYPALEASRQVMFLVAGEEKRAIFARVMEGEEDLPVARLRPTGGELWLTDAAVAA